MAEKPGPRRFAGASALAAAAHAVLRRGRNRGGGRRAEASVPSTPVEFDASIALHDGHLHGAGLGGRAEEAVHVVRAAVRSMRGAGWIGVEYLGPWCGGGWAWMPRAEWLTIYRRWSAVPPEGPERDRLRGSVEETVMLALEEVAGR